MEFRTGVGRLASRRIDSATAMTRIAENRPVQIVMSVTGSDARARTVRHTVRGTSDFLSWWRSDGRAWLQQ
jgi:hypothetical protein